MFQTTNQQPLYVYVQTKTHNMFFHFISEDIPPTLLVKKNHRVKPLRYHDFDPSHFQNIVL